jgi:resuscitation-promoting factor RpfB
MRKHHILAVLIAMVVGLSPSAHRSPTQHQIHHAHRSSTVLSAPALAGPVPIDPTSAFVRPRLVEPTTRPGPGVQPTPAAAWVASPPRPPAREPVVGSPPPAPDPWAALRRCESGDDYGADTGNGYYGAYQFTAGTWASLGLAGLPSEASPATQDRAARELQAQRGWTQWPACAGALGLQ